MIQFAQGLQQLLDYYGITASALADTINVQRSSISHLLSERNKPSLDFIMKILEVYPEVSWEWLLHGKGEFPKNVLNKDSESYPPKTSIKVPEPDLFSNTEVMSKLDEPHKKKKITKIIMCYDDQTFEVYEQ